MDRRTALERLDAVRPGSDDLSDPEMAGVRDALAGDDELRSEFDHLREWDRGLAAAMHGAPVPAGLKDRLLTRLAEPGPGPPARATSLGRRRMLASLATIAAGVAAATVYWTVTDSHEPVTLAEARDAAAGLLDPRAEGVPFNGDFEPKLPDSSWESRLTVVPRRFGLLGENGEHRAAAWRVSSGGRAAWQAVLVAIPIDDVASPPVADAISDRDYLPPGQMAGLQSVSWTQGDFVYVCVVERGGLDALMDELHNARFA